MQGARHGWVFRLGDLGDVLTEVSTPVTVSVHLSHAGGRVQSAPLHRYGAFLCVT
jgi:hypothetical protein